MIVIVLFIINFIYPPKSKKNIGGVYILCGVTVKQLSRTTSGDAKIYLPGWNFFLVF